MVFKLRYQILFLFLGMSSLSYAQQANPLFMPDDDRGGFYAMTPDNDRAVIRHRHYQTPVIERKSHAIQRSTGSIKKHRGLGALPVIRLSVHKHIRITPNKRLALKGPKAKNYKPWKQG